MKRQIRLNNKRLSYTLRKSKRAKRMRLAVYCDGSIVVTTPVGLNESVVEKYLREKSAWLFSKVSFFKQYEGHKISNTTYEDYIKHKDEALLLAIKLAHKYCEKNNFVFNKINIKNQKTRWGSCSKKGNLNFNYKIIYLPSKTAEYIVVHELCHLKEFNHSRKFWALVAKLFPEYLEIKMNLKRSGFQFV